MNSVIFRKYWKIGLTPGAKKYMGKQETRSVCRERQRVDGERLAGTLTAALSTSATTPGAAL